MTFVIDASVAVKWFVQEPLHTEARSFIERNDPLCAPDLLFAEVANVGWKLVMRGDIEQNQAFQMVAEVGEPFSKIISSSLLIDRAFQFALVLSHPVYDCLYLVCAEAAEAVLVTADARFYNAVQGRPEAKLVRHLSDVPP